MRGGTLSSVPPRNKPNNAPKRLILPINTKRGAPMTTWQSRILFLPSPSGEGGRAADG